MKKLSLNSFFFLLFYLCFDFLYSLKDCLMQYLCALDAYNVEMFILLKVHFTTKNFAKNCNLNIT